MAHRAYTDVGGENRSCNPTLQAFDQGWRASGKSEAIAAFVKRLYCKKCIGPSGEKRRHLKVEQTREPPDGPLLPGPDEVEWKRFVVGVNCYAME